MKNQNLFIALFFCLMMAVTVDDSHATNIFLEVPVEMPAETPWGRAIEKNYSIENFKSDFNYRFSTFSFPNTKKLEPQKLQKIKPYFMNHRKCVVETSSSATPFIDGQNKEWPQILLSGHCAGDGEFRELIFIAENQLYRLTTSSPLLFAQRKLKPNTLDKALQELLKQCRFENNGFRIFNSHLVRE